MKKAFAILLSLVLMLSLAVPAMAEGETGPYTVTIKNATGHTYQIYQIFTGDLATSVDANNVTTEILSNLKYGTDYVPTGKNVGDDAEIPDDPTTITPTGTGTAMTANAAGDEATATGLVAGYYMIKDTTATLPDSDTKSAVIFQVVGNTEIYSKHTGTTIVKKVQDVNDTTGEYTKNGNDTWIDSADYDIGDTVPFKSTANFEGLDNYETYKVIFTDTMAKGLTYNTDMKVYVNGVDKTSAFDITTAACADTTGDYVGGTVITVTCNDITAIDEDMNAATIVLEYSATLNSDANLGAPGNPNKIKVTTTPEGTGETVEDVNIVFTYKVKVDKYTTIAEKEVALTGAVFTLYKEVADADTEDAKTGAAIKRELLAANASIKADALKDGAYYVIAAEVEGDATGSTFGFTGIDDGTYVLTETTIPEGYNAWAAEEFTVEATHEVDSADPELNTLTGGDLVTGEVSTGILSTKIENNAGATLPETGGMGTTIFYIVGGVMVAAAVVLLITKKRMSAEG